MGCIARQGLVHRGQPPVQIVFGVLLRRERPQALTLALFPLRPGVVRMLALDDASELDPALDGGGSDRAPARNATNQGSECRAFGLVQRQSEPLEERLARVDGHDALRLSRSRPSASSAGRSEKLKSTVSLCASRV